MSSLATASVLLRRNDSPEGRLNFAHITVCLPVGSISQAGTRRRALDSPRKYISPAIDPLVVPAACRRVIPSLIRQSRKLLLAIALRTGVAANLASRNIFSTLVSYAHHADFGTIFLSSSPSQKIFAGPSPGRLPHC